jgi:hypothetical protein
MNRFYDIFNGDADGLCALVQLRLAEPRDAVLVTGVKRDIALLDRVDAGPGDELTVLDISLDVNRAALERVLDRGARVRYFDHHHAGDPPGRRNLAAHIDLSADVCTSLIVDRHLEGRHRAWAVAGAFGDNLAQAATRAAAPLRLNAQQLGDLRALGECINYNAYGDSVDDLFYQPAELFRDLVRYRNPFDFVSGEPILDILREGMADDLFRAEEVAPEYESPEGLVCILPDAPWARRVNGMLANRLASSHAARAHAVLVRTGTGYRVSVRAPQVRLSGADALCRAFPTGGGRAGAAGINFLPDAELGRFVTAFAGAFDERVRKV